METRKVKTLTQALTRTLKVGKWSVTRRRGSEGGSVKWRFPWKIVAQTRRREGEAKANVACVGKSFCGRQTISPSSHLLLSCASHGHGAPRVRGARDSENRIENLVSENENK